jgi:anaerobic carbon-monoxide dehydrogenase iron sulfur subunit
MLFFVSIPWISRMILCDVRTCVGCRMCEVACSSHHFGAVSPGWARIRVAKLEEIGIDFAVACLSCAEKPCLDCPTGALSVGARAVILLDAGLCNACETCVSACPIGAVGFCQGQPLICDLCDGDPACVRVCPSQALSFREDYREVPLAEYTPAHGHASQRRARLALAQGSSLRACWKNGDRIAP